MPTSLPTEPGEPRELDVALLIADLSGYTALTETHGALHASEVVLRFQELVRESLEPGVSIINSIGDDVLCAGADTRAVVCTAFRLGDAIGRKPDFPKVRTGIHRGLIVEREGQVFGAPINLTARVAAYANGGQILCTEPIVRTASEMDEIETRPIGERQFRNVLHPVAVFELARAQERRAATAIDPVCRMQVEIDRAVATVAHGGATYHFCSLKCAGAFVNAPQLYAGKGGG
jgi:class 3 adenylate cyclase/YHS domain-containing protein